MSESATTVMRVGERWRSRWLTWRAFVILGGLILVVAACSDGGQSADPPATTTTSTAEGPSDDVVELTAAPEPEVAVSDEEGAPEYLDLAYHGTYFDTEFYFEPAEECDETESGIKICDWELTDKTFASHLGIADDHLKGTLTIGGDDGGECVLNDGQTALRNVTEGNGTFTTAWGDELHYRVRTHSCALGPEIQESLHYWVVVGGTGRFEDATGTMSTHASGEMGSISVGTLRVRADLWDEMIPDAN